MTFLFYFAALYNVDFEKRSINKDLYYDFVVS